MSTKREDACHNGEIPRQLPVPSVATSTEMPAPSLCAKKRGPMKILRAALFIVRRRSTKKKTTNRCGGASQSGENCLLRNIFGVVHPLQQLENAPAPVPLLTPEPVEKIAGFHERPKEAWLTPPSPSCFSVGCFSADSMSRYASFENLRSFDTCTGGDMEEEKHYGAPHDIDRQAEEFIAKFYEQMRQQKISQEEGLV